MKTKPSHFAIALLLACNASTVTANEAPSGETEVAVASETTSMDAADYGERLSGLKRQEIILEQQRKILALENEIAKLKLEAAGDPVEEQVEDAIKDEREAMQKRMDEMERAYEARIRQLQARLTGEDPAAAITGNIYVTRVAGAGDNLRARVFYENNIRDRVVGEQIAPGVVITKIHPNGIVVNDNGSERFIDITTDGLAYLKTFEPLVKDEPDGPSDDQMFNAVPMMPGPGMVNTFGTPQ